MPLCQEGCVLCLAPELQHPLTERLRRTPRTLAKRRQPQLSLRLCECREHLVLTWKLLLVTLLPPCTLAAAREARSPALAPALLVVALAPSPAAPCRHLPPPAQLPPAARPRQPHPGLPAGVALGAHPVPAPPGHQLPHRPGQVGVRYSDTPVSRMPHAQAPRVQTFRTTTLVAPSSRTSIERVRHSLLHRWMAEATKYERLTWKVRNTRTARPPCPTRTRGGAASRTYGA